MSLSLSPIYPATPLPPMQLSAPHGSSVVFLVLCSVIFAVAIAGVTRQAFKGDPFGLWFFVGGLFAGILEPLLDQLGLLWFAKNNAAIAVTTFHRYVPLYVVMGYAFFFGALANLAYRALIAGRSRNWFFGLYAAAWLADAALQITGAQLHLYRYYGYQPFLVGGAPAWWFTIDATLPILAGGAVFAMRRHLIGWRSLVIVPIVPGMYAGLNAAAGWPLFSAINSHPPVAVIWLAGAITMGLALLFGGIVLAALVPGEKSALDSRDDHTQPLDVVGAVPSSG